MITTGNANFVSPTKKQPGHAIGTPSERQVLSWLVFYVYIPPPWSLCSLCETFQFLFNLVLIEKACRTKVRSSQKIFLRALCVLPAKPSFLLLAIFTTKSLALLKCGAPRKTCQTKPRHILFFRRYNRSSLVSATKREPSRIYHIQTKTMGFAV
mgnify:FL=1|jgi:hypothetical protein